MPGLSDVYVKIVLPQTGSPFYFSPGCSVTETFSKGITTAPGVDGKASIWTTNTDNSHTIRIDAQIMTYSSETSDGLTTPPAFEPSLFVEYVRETTSEQKHYLYWRNPMPSDGGPGSGYYEGLVKNVTVTQRAGEGNLVDVSVLFEVGDVSSA